MGKILVVPGIFEDTRTKDRYKSGVNLPASERNLFIAFDDKAVEEYRNSEILVTEDDNLIKNAENKLHIPCIPISEARSCFKFPPNNPVHNTAYAMVDVFPNYYVPLSQFHEYYKQTKHAAFIELCAHLGAKEIYIESAEINNQTLDVNGDIRGDLANLNLGISIRESRDTGMKAAFTFSKANRRIKDFDTPWMYTESSWQSLNNLRRRNHLQTINAEFNCTDDFGINANLSAQLGALGINIGGKFTGMTKIRLVYAVIFWE
jgi:hypothetical protein